MGLSAATESSLAALASIITVGLFSQMTRVMKQTLSSAPLADVNQNRNVQVTPNWLKRLSGYGTQRTKLCSRPRV